MTHLTGRTSDVWIPQPAAVAARCGGRLADLVQMTKPRLSLMVVATAYVGLPWV